MSAGLFFILWLLGSGLALPAQARQAAPADTTRQQPIVTSVRFVGNTLFPDEILALRVRTRPNRRFLEIPGFTWWLWLYRLGGSGALGERLGAALQASGEPPAYLDPSLLAADVERLQLFYRQEGFREARVTAQVDTTAGGRHARVTFRIDSGQPTYVRRVTFDGLEMLGPEQQERLLRGSLLRPIRPAQEPPLQFRARSQRYSEPTLLEERRRILSFLRDEGYADVSRDSIRALIFPQSPDSFDIVFRVRPGARYRFGDVHFAVGGPEARVTARADTLLVVPADASPGGVVSAHIVDESKLDPALLERALQFLPGDWYNQSRLLATKRRLEATGIFAFTDILALPPDTAGLAAGAAPRLPHRFDLRTRRRHQVRLETFMFQRSGTGTVTGADVAAGGSELGTGVGVAYENANLMGGGETFQVRLTGSIAADDLTNMLRLNAPSAQAEISTSLTYPYLVVPFRGLDRWLNLYDARTRLSFSLLTARRDELKLIIRGRGTARFRLEMMHTPTIASLVDLLDVSLSNPDTLPNFRRDFLNKIDSLLLDDPVQRAQILQDYTQPQVNSALRYTFRSARVNPLRRDRGYSYEGAFEVGNNLPYLLDRAVFSPDTLEGSLPGLPFFDGDRADTRLVYRQYFRLVGDLRQYLPVSRRRVLAWKLIAGMAHPTGESDLVPFDRRFYSGGATSVRGWELRTLGPGSTAPLARPDEADVTNILGGDIKLEASLELRNTLLRNALAADWMAALFVDAGNVWFGPRNPGDPAGQFRLDSFYRELGVGSGVGLRIAWEYVVARFDLAYKVYDPARGEHGFLPDGLRGPLLHFGIGHAF